MFQGLIHNLIKHYNFAKKILILQTIRQRLKHSKLRIFTYGFGAGSKFSKSRYKSISTIVRKETSPLVKSLFICLIVKIFGVKRVLELGTNLGFNANFLALCTEQVVSIEGERSLLKFAKFIANKLENNNLYFVNDTFENVLPNLIDKFAPQLIFIDGNHTYFGTKWYLETIVKQVRSTTVVIIDDINWSEQMRSLWRKLNYFPFAKKLNFLQFGLLIFKPDKR